MQLFLERLMYFWAGITAIGLLIAVAYWAIATIIYVAFIALFVAIAAREMKTKENPNVNCTDPNKRVLMSSSDSENIAR